MLSLKSSPIKNFGVGGESSAEGVESRGKPVSSGPTDTQPVASDGGQCPPTDANPMRQRFQLAGGTAK